MEGNETMRYEKMDEASREEVERGISAAFANVADRLWSEVREAAACVEPDREAVYGKVRAAGAVAEIEDLYKFNNLTAEDIMGAVCNVSPEAYADPATYEPTIARLAAECSDGHLPEKDEVLASLNGMKRGLPLSPEAQAIKEALEQGRDLYNVETGEFCFLWNDLGSIASTDVPLDDPGLMDAVASDGFDFYEDLVGAPNRTAYIVESNESRLEDGDGLPDPDNPAHDERDEVFERMASEDGWGDASRERVLAAMERAGLLCDVDALSQNRAAAARPCDDQSLADRGCGDSER